jgi:phosphatidylinositol alpha 1,6-mannosyltransferase
MSCGKPVVTTSAGGSSEYVAHEKFGLVVPAASAEALADAICSLAKDAEIRAKYGTAARKFTIENLDRRRIARWKTVT